MRTFAPLLVICVSQVSGSVLTSDTIVSIATANAPDSGLINLSSLTINRGGAEVTISIDDLVGINVLDYDNAVETIPQEGAILGTPSLPSGPAAGNRAALLDGDNAINSGVNNPSEDEGILFQFDSFITNGTGADLVIFDFGAAPGSPVPSDPSGNTLAPPGDPFVLAAVTTAVGSPVDSTRMATFESGDYSFLSEDGFASGIFFFNPAEGEDFSSLTVLENGGLERNDLPGATAPTTFDLNLFGILVDLSDLGFEEGEAVNTLRILSSGPTFGVDPSFIAGLPPAETIPEPSSTLLLFATVCFAVGKRKR